MFRRTTCVALIAIGALTVACNEGTIKVHSLTFKGVHKVDDSALRAALATQTSSKLPWGKKAYFDRGPFDDDLKRIKSFYLDRGYPDARVSGFDVKLNKAQDSVDVTITIVEGDPIIVAAVNLVGFDVLPPANLDRLKRQLPLKVGQPRDRQLVVSTHEMALNALRDEGYPFSALSIGEDDGPNGKSATMAFNAVAGRLAHVGTITIDGNPHVSSDVIQRGLSFKTGDLYRRSRLQETQRLLYTTQLFDFVNVAPTAAGTKSTDAPTEPSGSVQLSTPSVSPAPRPLSSEPADVPTQITVAESKPRRLNFGVGYGTEEKARVDAEYHRLNFLGGGRSAGVHARWSSLDRGVKLDFTQPYVFAPKLSLGAMAQQWYALTPAYQSVTTGAKATLTHTTSQRTHFSVSITSERDSSSVAPDVLGNLALRNNLIALGLNPTTGEQSGTLNALGFDFQHSTADSALNAHRGHQFTFHIEQAGRVLPGTFKYWSLTADARQYFSLGNQFVWANRVQFGNISPANDDIAEVPFGKRFFLGGSTSIRGWGIYEVGPLAGGLPVGGDSMAAFSSELRIPIQGKLGAVAFLDAGNVWANSFAVDLNDLRYAVGTGLRYQSLIGSIRFDAGYQLNPEPGLLISGLPESRRWRLHFSVGQAF